MYRSDWELAVYVRQHIAELAGGHRVRSQFDSDGHGVACRVRRLRRRLGIGLIQVGQALAGYDAARGLPTSPARPATAR